MSRGALVRLWWLLGRRWLRARAPRQAAVIALVGATVITGIYVAAASFMPSAAQQAEAALGPARSGTYASFTLGQLDGQDLRRVDRVVRASLPSGSTFLESRTLRPDRYPKFYFQGPSAVVRYFEQADVARAAPGRYSITGGRAPARPSEVAVTKSLARTLGNPKSFTVLSGNSTLRVVGIFQDSDARLDDEIMAAPGTWSALRPRDADHQYQPQEAQLQVRWSGSASIARVSSVLQGAVPTDIGATLFSADVVMANLTSRRSLLSQPAQPFGSNQVVVSYGPFALLVLLLAAVLLSSMRRPAREFIERITLLGVPVRSVAAPVIAATTAVVVVAACLGTLVGIAVMALVRPLLLQRLADQTLSPLTAPSPEIGALAVLGLFIVVAGLVWNIGGQTPGAAGNRLGVAINLAIVRRFLVGALGVLAWIAATRAHSAAPYLALSAVLLLVPDLFWLILWATRLSSARLLLVRRLAYGSRATYSTAIIAIGACLAVPLALAGQAASSLANDASFRYSVIPSGQIWVERSGDTGDVRGVAKALSEDPRLPPAIPVAATMSAPKADGSAGPVARLVPAADGGVAIMVLRSLEDARRLFGSSLTAASATALSRGGVLNFGRPRGELALAVYANGGEVQRTTSRLATVDTRVDRAFTIEYGGAVLASTARALDLPISTPNKYLYVGVTSSDIGPAVTAAVAAGYDGEFVHYRVNPPAPTLPPAAGVFTIGLIAAALAILFLIVRLQASLLRASATRLYAIGLEPSWTRSTLYLSVALILGTGGLGGLCAGAASALLLPVPVSPTALPIEGVAITVLAIIVAGMTAARFSSRGFSVVGGLDV